MDSVSDLYGRIYLWIALHGHETPQRVLELISGIHHPQKFNILSLQMTYQG